MVKVIVRELSREVPSNTIEPEVAVTSQAEAEIPFESSDAEQAELSVEASNPI